MTVRALPCLLSLVASCLVVGASLEAGARRPMTAKDLLTMERVGAPAVSPDGRWVAFTVTRSSLDKNQGVIDLWLVPADGGAPPRRLTWNEASGGGPAFSPDGKRIAFAAQTWPDLDADWKGVEKRLDEQKDDKVQAKISESRLLRYGDQYRTDGRVWHLFAVDLYALPIDGGEPRLVARGGTTGGVRVGTSPSGETFLVFQRQSILQPSELYRVGLAGGEPKALTSFNAERIAGLDLGTVGEATFAGARGEPVHMLLAFPPGFDKSRKWPLLQLLHGGPHSAAQDEFDGWNPALFASPGYVVAVVNFHGSIGYAQAFAGSIAGDYADLPYADIQKATDYLIAQGYIDDRRLAAGGGSYGGYLADWILGHTDRFAALFTHAGIYDLMAELAADHTWGGTASYGGTPWTDPARLDRQSPSHYAASFATPTLILHGEQDYRVPVTQGLNLYGVLQAKGVPSRIVVFPDEGHGIARPQGSVLWYREVFAWLERYLAGGKS